MSFFGKENESKDAETPDTPLRTYLYSKPGLKQKVHVRAHYVTFNNDHIAFWQSRTDEEQNTLILAEANTNVLDLKEVTA
jgi:hypothetical protein